MPCSSETARDVQWCITVIRHAATRAKRKKRRWARELLMLNSTTEDGGEWGEFIPCPSASQAFRDVDLMLLFTSLPQQQSQVLSGIYLKHYTEAQVANDLHISQQKVSRLKARALQRIRQEEMDSWITHN